MISVVHYRVDFTTTQVQEGPKIENTMTNLASPIPNCLGASPMLTKALAPIVDFQETLKYPEVSLTWRISQRWHLTQRLWSWAWEELENQVNESQFN